MCVEYEHVLFSHCGAERVWLAERCRRLPLAACGRLAPLLPLVPSFSLPGTFFTVPFSRVLFAVVLVQDRRSCEQALGYSRLWNWARQSERQQHGSLASWRRPPLVEAPGRVCCTLLSSALAAVVP